MAKEKLWGGAFAKDPDETAWNFGRSIDSDLALWDEEIEVSRAHAKMLGATGIIPLADAETLRTALNELRPTEIGDVEDIHAAVELLLKRKLGDVADKLHAGRSRNDQIATVARLWLRRQSEALVGEIRATQATLLGLGERYKAAPMPGFTHMQAAQPITLGFHLLAYFWMLERDAIRFRRLRSDVGLCPLGAAALAGTSLPIDRAMTARELGFDAPTQNALDATSDRDFVGDALHACATLMQHLSRLSQELVLWSTPLYRFVDLDEAFTTGSSIMPQKRNPDMAELIRGRSARVIGHWTAFMAMMRALPLGYNRDQQEDKPPLFDSIALCRDSLALSRGMLETARFRTERMAEIAGEGFSTATSVAERMVEQGVPFRQAHEATGKLVRQCEQAGSKLDLDVEACLTGREGYGGPGPTAIDHQIAEARAILDSP